MRRVLVVALVVLFLIALILVARGGSSPKLDDPASTNTTPTSDVPEPVVLIVSTPVDALKLSQLQRKLRARTRQLAHRTRQLASARRYARSLRRTLRQGSSTHEAIDLACSVYGNCSTLWRRAGCESHLNPYARNASGASGLFQFLPSTWRTTPYAGFSIWSPYASALAAGWMQTHGRGGEWVCQ